MFPAPVTAGSHLTIYRYAAASRVFEFGEAMRRLPNGLNAVHIWRDACVSTPEIKGMPMIGACPIAPAVWRGGTEENERGFAMSGIVAVQTPAAAPWQRPESRPLDEAVWQAWLAKGRDAEQRRSRAAHTAICWGTMITLLATAALGAQLTRYEVVVRFVVSAAAVAMMLQVLRRRKFALATLFGALVALYNPIAPAFRFSGGLERAFVAASAIPFIAPLVWRNEKAAARA